MKRLILLTFAFFVATNLKAQEPQLSFFSIMVQDIDTSINWYTDILGFTVENKIENEARGIKQANLKLNYISLELIETEKSRTVDTGNAKSVHEGFFKIGFSIEDFDNTIKAYIKKGVRLRGQIVTDENSEKKMVIILDPDGNRVQFFEK